MLEKKHVTTQHNGIPDPAGGFPIMLVGLPMYDNLIKILIHVEKQLILMHFLCHGCLTMLIKLNDKAVTNANQLFLWEIILLLSVERGEFHESTGRTWSRSTLKSTIIR